MKSVSYDLHVFSVKQYKGVVTIKGTGIELFVFLLIVVLLLRCLSAHFFLFRGIGS